MSIRPGDAELARRRRAAKLRAEAEREARRKAADARAEARLARSLEFGCRPEAPRIRLTNQEGDPMPDPGDVPGIIVAVDEAVRLERLQSPAWYHPEWGGGEPLWGYNAC